MYLYTNGLLVFIHCIFQVFNTILMNIIFVEFSIFRKQILDPPKTHSSSAPSDPKKQKLAIDAIDPLNSGFQGVCVQ